MKNASKHDHEFICFMCGRPSHDHEEMDHPFKTRQQTIDEWDDEQARKANGETARIAQAEFQDAADWVLTAHRGAGLRHMDEEFREKAKADYRAMATEVVRLLDVLDGVLGC